MAAMTDPPTLVARIRARDLTAQCELIELYKEEVCRVISTQIREFCIQTRTRVVGGRPFRSQVDSIFNDVLVRLVVRIREGTLSLEDSKLVPYMVVIARNLLLTRMRKKRLERSVGAEALDGEVADGPSPDVATEERELVERYREILSRFDERRRVLVELRIDEGLKFDEIGEILGMGAQTARARYSECLADLRRLGGGQ